MKQDWYESIWQLLIAAVIGLGGFPAVAVADGTAAPYAWLPYQLSDQNTKVEFEIDSTWHLIHGGTSKVSGKIEQRKSGEPATLLIEAHFPVRMFDTDNESRDERLREVMASELFPEVTVRTSELKGECLEVVKDRLSSPHCSGALRGTLTIRDVTKDVELPFKLTPMGEGEFPDSYLAEGEFEIKWAEFGVEDPSILIAKLYETAKIKFQVRIDRDPRESVVEEHEADGQH